MPDSIPVKKALISVFNKTGLGELAAALHEKGVELYSTGGTYKHLTEDLKLPAKKVDSVTDFPEMMDGRVKTLHPKIFGGILARRNENQDLQDADAHGIPLFDLIVVNLYDFASAIGKTRAEQVRLVDIGGPAMLRAAAKNHEAVCVLSDPADYPGFLQEFVSSGNTSLAFRETQATNTFDRTSRYDAMITREWRASTKGALPTSLSLEPQMPLRYGENPHQRAVWAGTPGMWKVLQGKELSYNNLLDAEAATRLVAEFNEPALSIIKHNSPCGAAAGKYSVAELFSRAFAADSKSAFGGIVASNRTIDAQSARAMGEIFLEVIVAPAFSSEALGLLSEKKNLRLVELANPPQSAFDIRASLGGWLVQDSDLPRSVVEMQTVTKAGLSPELEADLLFAWKVTKHLRSNAIALAKDKVTLSLGGGQTSRVDAVQIALGKCPPEEINGAVLASDAFFPFRDSIDLLSGKGIAAIIQPGGSKRDTEVIQACDELGIAMVFTGTRHFRH